MSSLTDALRFEWVRVRTLRSTYWLAGLSVLLAALVAGAIGAAFRGDPIDPATSGAIVAGGAGFSPLPFTAVFMGLLGAFAVGHEYRHGTIQPTLLALPRRWSVVVGKLVVVMAVAAVTAALSLAANLLAGTLGYGGGLDLDEPVPATAVGYVLLVVLWALVGAALALLFRNLPAVVTVLLVVPLVVEPTITVLQLVPALDFLGPVSRFLPFSAGQLLATSADVASDAEAAGIAAPLGRWAGGAVFAAFVAAVLAPAWVLFEKRDA